MAKVANGAAESRRSARHHIAAARHILNRWLAKLVEPSSSLTDHEAIRNARLLASVCLILGIVSILSVSGWVVVSSTYPTGWKIQLAVLPVSIVGYILARTRYYCAGIGFLSISTFLLTLLATASINQPFVSMRLIVPIIVISIFYPIRITASIALLGIGLSLWIFHDTTESTQLAFSLSTLAAASGMIIVVNHLVRMLLARLEQGERQFHLLESNIGDVLWIMDRNLNLTYVSPSVTRLRGYTADEAKSQPISTWLTPQSLETITKYYGDVMRDEKLGISYNKTLRMDLEQTRKDGSTVWTEITSRAQYNEYGKLDGVFGVTRDITERRLLDQQRLDLALANDRVNLLHRLINNLSHDFMTPISSINTNLYILQRRDQDETNKDHLVRIALQVDRLRTMIESVMTMARLENLEPDKVECELLDLPRTLQGIIDHYRQRAALQEVLIDYEMSGKLPQILVMPEYFNKVIGNLLDNALAFTPAGGRITVKAAPHPDDEMVEIMVCDSGTGMSAEVVANAFEPFYKGEAHRPLVGGPGLGLSIAQRVVKLHQGSIEIESQPRHGTMVKIRLPAGSTAIN